MNHKAEEYARRDATTGRCFFGNSKRSIDGTHQHISEKHTGLYFAELDYKYNTRKATDGERTDERIKKTGGKRLMLPKPKKAQEICDQ